MTYTEGCNCYPQCRQDCAVYSEDVDCQQCGAHPGQLCKMDCTSKWTGQRHKNMRKGNDHFDQAGDHR